MGTKIIRTVLILVEILLIAVILLADICAMATVGSLNNSIVLLSSFIRCVATLAFTIFYYISVSDSFSSDSLLFPLLLLFLSASETRILENVQNVLGLHIIPNYNLVGILLFSSIMIALCLIGYALLSNASKKDLNLYTTASIAASLVITYYAPIAGTIPMVWSSKTLFFMISFAFGLGVLVALIQTIQESSKSSRVKFLVCMLLLINEYINLVFDSLIMNAVGTLLFIVSLVFVVALVKMNSTRL